MRYNAINFMSKRQINKDLQMRVLKYIEYIHEIENDSPENGLSVINKISSHLKVQLFKDYYGKILSQNKYFALNYSQETINKLALKIQEKLFVPGEVIFEQGEQDYRLFYLIKGETEYYIQNKGGNKHSEYQTIANSNETQFFGYKGFISGIPREMSCRSTNISHVFFISRDDLISVLKEDPLDYEQFCKARDEYLLYTNSLGEQCFGCKDFGHTLRQCPRIHLVRNRQLIVLKYNYSIDQKRETQIRRIQKYSCLQNIDITSFNAKKYRKKLINNLKKQNEIDQSADDSFTLCLMSDELFSKRTPYIKFIGDEMILYDKYHSINLDKDSSQSDNSSYLVEHNDSKLEILDEIEDKQNQKSQKSIIYSEDEDEQSSNESVSDYNINSEVSKHNQSQLQNDDFNNKQKKKQSSNFIDSHDRISQLRIGNENQLNFQQSNNFFSQKDAIQKLTSIKCQKQVENVTIDKKINNEVSVFDNYVQKDQQMQENIKQNISQQSSTSSLSSSQCSGNIQNESNKKKNEAIKLPSLKKNNQEEKSLNPSNNTISTQKDVKFADEKDQVQIHKLPKQSSLNKQQFAKLIRSGSRQQTEQMLNNQHKLQFLSQKSQQPRKSVRIRNSIFDNLIKNEGFNNSQPQNERSLQRTKSGSFSYGSGVDQAFLSNLRQTQKIKQSQQTQKDNFMKMYENQNQLLLQIIQNLQTKNNKIKQSKINSLQNFEDADLKNNYQNLEMYTPEADVYGNSTEKKNIYFNHKYYHKQSIHFNVHKRNQQGLADLFMFDFDSMKEYQKYFPHNNAKLVCMLYKLNPEKVKRSNKINYSRNKNNEGTFTSISNKKSIFLPNNNIKKKINNSVILQ